MSSTSSKANGEAPGKRPFNKKKWREQKYSKHQKIEKWEERRRKAALHKLRKELRKEDPNAEIHGSRKVKDGKKQKPHQIAYQEALQEYERIHRARAEQRQEVQRRQKEREEALQRYRQKKMERYLKLSRKTKKGQPIMKERIELLLEQIEKMVD